MERYTVASAGYAYEVIDRDGRPVTPIMAFGEASREAAALNASPYETFARWEGRV